MNQRYQYREHSHVCYINQGSVSMTCCRDLSEVGAGCCVGELAMVTKNNHRKWGSHLAGKGSWKLILRQVPRSALVFGSIFFIFFCGSFLAGWISTSRDSPSQTSSLPTLIRTPRLPTYIKTPFPISLISPSPLPPQPPPPSQSASPPPLPLLSNQFLITCEPGSTTNQTCPHTYPTTKFTSMNDILPSTCPDHFRFIHEDLRPWKLTGITRDMVEKAKRTAHFRLVILDGRVYMEKFKQSIQTRDVFTQWGILQLLRWYPGRLPNLELMFDTNDRPVIRARDFRRGNSGPPPLFRYCSDWLSLDIVFPDWSFWGWAETNLKPWGITSTDIKEGNKKIKWKDRVPYAYWKGNPHVSPIRQDLMKCNVTDRADWNTRLFIQDWLEEAKTGYNNSKVEDQCTYRYKIYVEGWAWSVSEKYILACDSMTLLIRPRYHDFFTRGIIPYRHYWPIRDRNKCQSLKFAVEWGNNHTEKAQEIGKAGSDFILEKVKMEYVYDYMFHLLNEYSKLLRLKPVVPSNAVELCPETMACQADGFWRRNMLDSLVQSPTDVTPCTLPEPFDPSALKADLDTKANFTRQVEIWEGQYWNSARSQK